MPFERPLTPASTLSNLRAAYAYAETTDTAKYMVGLELSNIQDQLARLRVYCREHGLLGLQNDLSGSVIEQSLADTLAAKTGIPRLEVLNLSLERAVELLTEHAVVSQKIPEVLPIKLNGQGEPVIVRGVEKPPLTTAQYNVIAVLIDAGENGLTKDQLAHKSGHGDAVRVLKRLSEKDADWMAVVRMAGKTGGRYRIIKNPH